MHKMHDSTKGVLCAHLEPCRSDDLVSWYDLSLAVDLIVTLTTTVGALIPTHTYKHICSIVESNLQNDSTNAFYWERPVDTFSWGQHVHMLTLQQFILSGSAYVAVWWLSWFTAAHSPRVELTHSTSLPVPQPHWLRT